MTTVGFCLPKKAPNQSAKVPFVFRMQRTQGLTSISSGTLCDFIDERSSITGMTSPVSIGMMLWPCAINKILEVKAHCALLEDTTNMDLQYYMQNAFNFILFGSVV